MPRLFGSSPSSSVTQRQQQQQQRQQRQEESRRRSSFAFLKHSPDRRTHSSMRRSREHAKQIAMQLSEQSPTPPPQHQEQQQQPPTPNFVDFEPFPITSPSSPTNIDTAYNMSGMQMSDAGSSLRKQRQHFQQEQSSSRGPVSLDAFVEEQEQQQQHVFSSPSARSSVGTTESTTSTSSRRQQQEQGLYSYHSSMPTLPSNASMQSRNVSSAVTTSSSGGAARRRRQRARQQQSSNSFSSSKSDVHVDYYRSLEDFSSTTSTPVSPYPLTRSSGSAKANHLVNYTQTPRRSAPIAPSPPASNRSLTSQMSIHSHNDFNAGFSFDAFGLDESQVDKEVHAALQDLVDGSRPDLGFFLQDQDDGDQEFHSHNFDTASSSRGSGDDGSSTPASQVLVDSAAVSADRGDGAEVENGFRVVTAVHKQSPTSSERSSLTSAGTNEYNPHASSSSTSNGVNRFKEQAGFFKSKARGHRLAEPQQTTTVSDRASGRRKPPVSPHIMPSPQQYAKSEPSGSTRFLSQSQDEPEDSSFPQTYHTVPNLILEEFPEPDFPEPEPYVSDDDHDSEPDDGRSPSQCSQSHPTQSQVRKLKVDESSALTTRNGPQAPPFEEGRRVLSSFSDVGAKSDVGMSSDVGARSDVAIASDVGVTSNGGVNSDAGPVPMDIMGKLKKKSTTAQRKLQEEKEAQRVSDLKRAWERRHELEANHAAERVRRRQTSISPLPRENIARLENQLGDELLSPEILERKRLSGTTVSMLKTVKKEDAPVQAQRAAECADQRTSFASFRQRLRPTHLRDDDGRAEYRSSQSDVGGYRRPTSFEMNAVRNRLNKPRIDSYGDSRSEVGGSTPSFLANVKLSSTGDTAKHDEGRKQSGSHYDGHSSVEDDEFDYGDEASDYSDEELEWMRQQEEEEFDAGFDTDQSDDEPKQRKMTYREKRELELKAERERKDAEEAGKKEPERDVAALIRRRIAANKQKAALAEVGKGESTENIATMRNRLRKVAVEESKSPRLPPSASKKFVHRSQDPPSAATKFLERSLEQPPSAARKLVDSSPGFSERVPEKASGSSDNKVPAQLNLLDKRHDATIETTHEMTGSGDSTSPSMHPPSMVASEVDSSSTARTFDEMSSSVKNLRRQATGAMGETSVQQERVEHESFPVEEKNVGECAKRPHPTPVGAVEEESISVSSKSTKSVLNALLGQRLAPPVPKVGQEPSSEPRSDKEDVSSALMKMHFQQDSRKLEEETSPQKATGSRPALKDDPKYARYFRMLKVGMPMDVVKHAMLRDDMDPSVMDGDHNKPVGGVPLKEDPKYERYFKMLAVGLPLGAVKNAMQRDGLESSVMDGDHNLPAGSGDTARKEHAEEVRPRDTHRRTRVHWETLRQVRASSLWAKIGDDPEVDEIVIDEDEFAELFQAELTPSQSSKSIAGGSLKRRGAAVRVIESKRANNGGIILARLKMTYDDMADTVDRIDENAMTAEQMQNIIEYLPTSAERKALEVYMLEGDQDAAEKFDGLCECEKFMVAMMTVKHAKRKVRALLFKLQFESCLESLEQDANVVETACDELKDSVRLRKLLGIVLNIGNRLNTAGASGKRKAGAFSLNSLLKLSQAKAFDKKTTFLHYVVLVVQRNNELLLNFKDDLPTALKADKIYWDQCISDLEDVENQLENVRRIALYQARLSPIYQRQQKNSKCEEDDESLSDASMTLEEEVEALRSSAIGLFTLGAIKKVSSLRDKVESTKVKFAKLLEYFGEEHRMDMQPHDLFNVIATFSRDFDKAKEKVLADAKKKKCDERLRARGGRASKKSQDTDRASPATMQDSALSPSNAASKRKVKSFGDSEFSSTKSDAGVPYSSYSASFSAVDEPKKQSSQLSRSSSVQQDWASLQQHSSTVNGMYETPRQPLARKARSSGNGSSSRNREAALRQKARMRRREGLGRHSSSTPGPNNSPEEGRPPRS